MNSVILMSLVDVGFLAASGATARSYSRKTDCSTFVDDRQAHSPKTSASARVPQGSKRTRQGVLELAFQEEDLSRIRRRQLFLVL
jgi:hypothetical protein